MNGEIHIGTCGFYYDNWKDSFYPPALPAALRFEYYTQYFDTTEIESTFYHFPLAATIFRWQKKSPEDFLFAFKAPRIITHEKRLKEVRDDLMRFLHLLKPLKSKISSLLFEIPPSLHKDIDLLAEFMALLPFESGWRFSMEFHHESWMDDEVFEMLSRYVNVTRCIDDFGKPWKETPNADFLYMRLAPVTGSYSGNLQEKIWAGLIDGLREFQRHKRHIFVYFQNDRNGNAIRDAMKLKKMLAKNN
jgi:uncharacterized protein YecE (DUF72 family)